MRSRGRLLLASSAVLLAAAGCSSDFGAKPGATKQSRSMLDLWRGAVIVAIVVGAIVVGLIIWCIVRYRARGRDDVPPQRQYLIPLEILYTAIPIVIVLVLFGFSYAVQDDVDSLSSHPKLTIDVQGFQWQWQFRYRHQGVTVTGVPGKPPVMVLPIGETVRLVLTSRDVIHSFYVPGFLFKRDAIPGVKNQFDIDVRDEGHYSASCAEFCGLDHAKMTFEVDAVSRSQFDAWLARMRTGP